MIIDNNKPTGSTAVVNVDTDNCESNMEIEGNNNTTVTVEANKVVK